MSRVFRLASLLRLRTIAEEQAAVELAAVTRRRDAAEARRRETEAMLEGTTVPRLVDSLGFQAVVASRVALSGLLVEHRATVQQAQATVQDAETSWSQARTRTRTLEKLAERHETEVRVEEARTEQAALDETAGRRAAARAAEATPAAADAHSEETQP